MSFSEIIYTTTGAFGWVVIGLAAIALAYVVIEILKHARTTVRNEGWSALWHQIRTQVLTRKRRDRH